MVPQSLQCSHPVSQTCACADTPSAPHTLSHLHASHIHCHTALPVVQEGPGQRLILGFQGFLGFEGSWLAALPAQAGAVPDRAMSVPAPR